MLWRIKRYAHTKSSVNSRLISIHIQIRVIMANQYKSVHQSFGFGKRCLPIVKLITALLFRSWIFNFFSFGDLFKSKFNDQTRYNKSTQLTRYFHVKAYENEYMKIYRADFKFIGFRLTITSTTTKKCSTKLLLSSVELPLVCWLCISVSFSLIHTEQISEEHYTQFA